MRFSHRNGAMNGFSGLLFYTKSGRVDDAAAVASCALWGIV